MEKLSKTEDPRVWFGLGKTQQLKKLKNIHTLLWKQQFSFVSNCSNYKLWLLFENMDSGISGNIASG